MLSRATLQTVEQLFEEHWAGISIHSIIACRRVKPKRMNVSRHGPRRAALSTIRTIFHSQCASLRVECFPITLGVCTSIESSNRVLHSFHDLTTQIYTQDATFYRAGTFCHLSAWPCATFRDESSTSSYRSPPITSPVHASHQPSLRHVCFRVPFSTLRGTRTFHQRRSLFTRATRLQYQVHGDINVGAVRRKSRVFARLVDEPDGATRFQLQLVQSSFPPGSTPPSNPPTIHSSDIVTNIEVQPVRSLKRMKVVTAEVAKNESIDKAVGLQRSKQAGYATWSSLLQKLEHRTHLVPQDQTTLKINGPGHVLEEFYYVILGDPTFGVVVDYPTIVHDHSAMLLAGKDKSIQGVMSLLSANDEWKTLCVDDEYKSMQSSASPPRPVVQGSSVTAAPRALDFILAPRSWTKSSFAEHVRAVVTSRPPHVLHRKAPHKDIVQKVLFELFYNVPNIRQVASWVAFHTAIIYLLRHRKILAATQLLTLMDRNGYPPSVETFNIFLRSCAENQNMVAFRHYLEVMHRDGISPNEGTWTALMAGAPTLASQQAIARSMFRRGFSMRAAFARDNAPQIIPYSFGPFLDSGGPVAEYLDTMDDLYGPTWLTRTATIRLLDALAHRGRVTEAVTLVNVLKSTRELTLSKEILHSLLRHCQSQLNADLAIWLIIYAAREWQLIGWDQIISDIMFQIAWKARMLNVLKITWKYSCARGYLSYTSRSRIYRSLMLRLQPQQEGSYRVWLQTAGAVVCAKDPLSFPSNTPHAILEGERRLFGAKPLVPVTTKLVEALTTDKQWIETKIKKVRGVTWKIRHAIRVLFATKPLLAVPVARLERNSRFFIKTPDGNLRRARRGRVSRRTTSSGNTKTAYVTRRFSVLRQRAGSDKAGADLFRSS